MSEMSNPKVVSGLTPEEEQQIIDLFKMEITKSARGESQEDSKFNDSDFQLPDVVKARITEQVFEELRRTSSGMGRRSTMSPSYLSKADQRSFEYNPLEHVIQKAMDVGGDFGELTDEERWFIGELTMKSLFPDD